MRAIQPEAFPPLLRIDLGMDHPDKPGDDERGEVGERRPLRRWARSIKAA
jgi:hypothetical protein